MVVTGAETRDVDPTVNGFRNTHAKSLEQLIAGRELPARWRSIYQQMRQTCEGFGRP
jgi:hypothetical protein